MKSRGPSVQMPSVQPSQRLRLCREILIKTAGWERGFCHRKWLIPRIIAPIRAYPRMKIKKPRRMNTKRMNGQGFLSFAVFLPRLQSTVHPSSLRFRRRSEDMARRVDATSSPVPALQPGGGEVLEEFGAIRSYLESKQNYFWYWIKSYSMTGVQKMGCACGQNSTGKVTLPADGKCGRLVRE